MRTHVAADLSQLAPGGENGGAARFVLDLLGALVPDDGLEWTLLVRPPASPLVEPLRAAGARVVLLRPGGEAEEPRRLRRTFRRLPGPLARVLPDGASLRRLGAEVLFSPLQSAAFHEPGLPHVAVAYDVQELHRPDFFSRAELRRRAAFRADLARCTRVGAISGATRDDLVARAGLRPDRVSVIHPAGPSERRPLPAAALAARLAGLGLAPGGYALYPANFWPHKNHERLLRAVAASPLARDPTFRLVLCGALDDRRRAVEALATDLGLGPRVLFLGYQPDEEMTALLQGARLLVFPSLFEGFGIPVVEAFRLGVPVACSDLPALREVAAEAAALFDPEREEALARAVASAWSDSAARARLVTAGAARAAAFPADVVAPAWAALLRAAASAHCGPGR
jgi:glycosyltransferase involved in cell wall biosynthesis